MVAEEDAEDQCPLCPPSGPPLRTRGDSLDLLAAAATETNLDDTPDFIWISCSKCRTWYHSVCLLLADDDGTRWTVPSDVRDEIATKHRDEGPWTNWVGWVDRWYCCGCTSASMVQKPKNDRYPRQPLVATLKRGFRSVPKPEALRSSTSQRALKRSPSSLSEHHRSSSVSKRSRLEPGRTPGVEIHETGQANGRVPIGDWSEHEEGKHVATAIDPQASEEDFFMNGERRPNGDISAGISRPRRQVALARPDYSALHHHIPTPTTKWLDLIADPEKYGRVIREGGFPRLPGHLVSRAWIESSLTPTNDLPPTRGDSSRNSSPLSSRVEYPSNLPPTLFYGPRREPLVVGPEEGGFESLGGKLPGKDLTVQDVAKLVGPETMVDVIDVATQRSSQWTLSKWAEAIAARRLGPDAGSSSKTFNVISLEISGTELAKRVRPPQLVRDIDWVDKYWPGSRTGEAEVVMVDPRLEEGVANGHADKGKAKVDRPKVQLYCLMGMQGSWTDWHIDFAASSVYYTVHTGAKTFFFIRPTEKNLAAYAEWSGSHEKQEQEWLGDTCDEVRKVTLHAGDTMIIPSGYIHAVYTPMDSIVFGGNFLHSYNIGTQLRLRQIEIDTKVAKRFRFPHFDRLCWYVADKYCTELRHLRAYRPRAQSSPGLPPPLVGLNGLHDLAAFLLLQVTILEDPEAEDRLRKAVYDSIPTDVVRDPSGLARELAWRVERELPKQQDSVDPVEGGTQMNGKQKPVKGGKQKLPRGMVMLPQVSRTWHFDPTPWAQQDHPPIEAQSIITRQRPNTDLEPRYDYPEKAKEVQTIYSQARIRATDLDDGRTVLEEQNVVFTERRIEWEAPLEE